MISQNTLLRNICISNRLTYQKNQSRNQHYNRYIVLRPVVIFVLLDKLHTYNLTVLHRLFLYLSRKSCNYLNLCSNSYRMGN